MVWFELGEFPEWWLRRPEDNRSELKRYVRITEQRLFSGRSDQSAE